LSSCVGSVNEGKSSRKNTMFLALRTRYLLSLRVVVSRNGTIEYLLSVIVYDCIGYVRLYRLGLVEGAVRETRIRRLVVSNRFKCSE